MKKIIILKLKGGLGNQLFSYAFSKHLAILNNATLFLDPFSGFKYDKVYKRNFALSHFNITSNLIPASFYNKHINPFLYRLFKKYLIDKTFFFENYLIEKSIGYDANYVKFKIHNKCYIDGYFQSEKYFFDIAHIIRDEFKIKEPIDSENIDLSKIIKSSQNSVMIHIRWFDKINSNSEFNVTKKYYTSAINYFKNIYENLHFFVFSDDIYLTRKLLQDFDISFTLITNNDSDNYAFADLWLMSLCKNFIIANSTFSWWGAWLSNYNNKIVIAPKMKIDGISAWGFDDLIPSTWIQI